MKMDSSSCLHSDRNLKGEKQYEKDDDSCDDGGGRAGRMGGDGGLRLMHSINTSGRIFDIIRGDMSSLCLQATLLRRRNYADDGMGVGSFCAKEM